jgi:hypothetical protein
MPNPALTKTRENSVLNLKLTVDHYRPSLRNPQRFGRLLATLKYM